MKKYKALIASSLFVMAALFPVSYTDGASQGVLKKGALLVARPELPSRFFSETVIIIVIHEKKGTLGLILNKPTGHSSSDILNAPEEMKNLHEDLFLGGPQNRHIATLLIDTDNPPKGADNVFGGIYFSGSVAAVLSGGKSEGHYEIRAYSGVSSWARGQLEMEVLRGDWLILEPDSEAVFSKEPEKLWEKLLKSNKKGSSFLLEVNNRNSK
ncbi:MAG: YqgE/AlgH family protein [bacterium]|nr:YqgE/AlgH family protein [bacterium]